MRVPTTPGKWLSSTRRCVEADRDYRFQSHGGSLLTILVCRELANPRQVRNATPLPLARYERVDYRMRPPGRLPQSLFTIFLGLAP